jgi:hypothetical protein
MFLFDAGVPVGEKEDSEVIGAIKKIDTTVLTPIEALNILHNLKQKVND